MTPAPIGDCRMFFQFQCWWLPDTKLVVAGCFRKVSIQRVAAASPRNGHRLDLTKRLSKHSLLKQRRTGYRPSALTRIIDDYRQDRRSGPEDNSTQEKRRMIDRSRRLAAGRKVPPLDRRPIAGTGDRQGSGRRSEIDPQHGLGQPKSLPHFMGRASPAIAATGGASNGRGTRTS